MSSCSCIHVHQENGPLVFHDTEPVARKEHKCYECRGKIQKGEKYRREEGIWEDGPHTYKLCMSCFHIREEFFCDGYNYGELWMGMNEHIQETNGQISSECLLKPPKVARDTLLDSIQEYWEDHDFED